jgi:hypothetical protein
MINNKYVFELDVKFNTDELIKIVNNRKVSGLRSHQQNAADYEYTNYLYNKHHKILGKIWNYYHLTPHTGFRKHIDARRPTALNIPLYGHEGSTTKFYEMPTDGLEYNDRMIAYDITKEVQETFSFTLTNPSIINVSEPHSVESGPQDRLIISWGIVVGFEEAKQYINEYGLD